MTPRPLVATTPASAANTAKGASNITYSVILSMRYAPCSSISTTFAVFSPSLASATPANTEKMTICKISFVAIASMMDRGTRCVIKLASVKFSAVGAPDVSAGNVASNPAPGWMTFTMTRPSASENNEAPMNQSMVLRPTRPKAFGSRICAMPTISVVRTSGAMTILMRRRNMSVTIFIADENSA